MNRLGRFAFIEDYDFSLLIVERKGKEECEAATKRVIANEQSKSVKIGIEVPADYVISAGTPSRIREHVIGMVPVYTNGQQKRLPGCRI